MINKKMFIGIMLIAAISFQANAGVTTYAPVNDSVAYQQWRYWYIDVPVGATNVTFTIAPQSGNTGDADIYTQFNAEPTLTSYLCRPFIGGSDETCSHDNPQVGRWYLGIYGFDGNPSYIINISITTPDIISYTVTYSPVVTGGSITPTGSGSITPTGSQIVSSGETQSFTVTANRGYSKNSTVGGTCPQGSWSGDVWTTGAITNDCTVEFSFTERRINIGALACQPPFLAQAANLRWHEHYLINPNLPTSVETWVVCNVAFTTGDLPDTFRLGAFGNATVPGTNALCYADIVDLRNQHIPEGGFLDNLGQNMTFKKLMSTQNPANTLWSAWATITKAEINDKMMDPPWTPIDPNQPGSKGPAYWSISTSCRLNPGQSINTIGIWPAP